MKMDNITPEVAPEQTQTAPAEPVLDTPEVTEPETSQPEQDAEQPKDEAAQAIKRMERRIARQTAAKYDAEARARQAAGEAEQLRQRLAQYEQAPEQSQQQFRPEDVLSLAERIAAQRLEQQQVVSTVKSVLKEGKAIEGFDDACNALNDELPFYTDKGAPTPFLQVVMETDAPAKVLHYLGTNPDVAAELSGLSATQVARRIARIESQLDAPAAPKVSKAPKPITPVKGTARDDGGLSDELPTDEWVKRFMKRIR